MIKYLFYLMLLVVASNFQPEKRKSVRFSGEDWEFPNQVKNAVSDHKMRFKPPGHYYKVARDSSIIHLEYNYLSGDFDNEYQDEKVLFDRSVHTYAFTYKNRPSLLDSLRTALEGQYHKKMTMRTDTQFFGAKRGSAATLQGVPIAYWTMPIDSSLSIGLRNKPSMLKTSPFNQQVEVLIMNNRSEQQLKQRMLSF